MSISEKKRKSPRAGKRRFTLVIFLILGASAGLRMGLMGQAWATAQDTSAIVELDDSNHCAPSEDMALLMSEITDRETLVSQRELELAARETDISVARDAVLKKLEELKRAEESLESRMTVSATASDSDISRLTSVYEAMKPKQAAELFTAMEPEFAAGFIARMAPDRAALILAGLPPETAYALSVVIAGRNANAAKE